MEVIIRYEKGEKQRAKDLKSDILQANRDFWALKFKSKIEEL